MSGRGAAGATDPGNSRGRAAEQAPSAIARARLTGRLLAVRLASRRFPYLPPVRIAAAQRRRLRETIAHAAEHVPHYREELRRRGLGPGDFRDASDLARLELVTRDHLQADPERFLSEAFDRARLAELRTGGSSGAPISIWRDPASLMERTAQGGRMDPVLSRAIGRRLRRRYAHIGSAAMGPAPPRARTFAQSRLFPQGLGAERRRFSMRMGLDEMATELNAYRPHVIDTYGSYAAELIAYAERPGSELALPPVITYAGDAMAEPARRAALDRGVEVVSVYNANEASPIGFECEVHRGHHLNADLIAVRIAGEDGEDLPPGEPGAVVISNLYARGTVLLNYRLGDVAALDPGSCACGRNLPLLSLIPGRTQDWLDLSDGRRIHPQTLPGCFLYPGIRGYRITQERPGRFAATVLPAPGADLGAISAAITAEFDGHFSAGDRIEVRFVEALPRTPGGKVITRAPS